VSDEINKAHQPVGPREPDNDMVICPHCTSQFVATPVNVQKRIAELEKALAAFEASDAGT
jgi:hypothetical protein